MKSKLIVIILFVIVNFFSGCQYNEFYFFPEDELTPATKVNSESPQLKSGIPGSSSECEDETYMMLTRNNSSLGSLTVNNDNSSLKVCVASNDYISFEEVQIWVGTDYNEVPTNKANIPIPGKFTFKKSGQQVYSFDISENEISDSFSFSDGTSLYLFVHAKAKNLTTGDTESVWSEGILYNSKNGACYSTYNLCIPTNGGGCFPHTAYCGSSINGSYFIDAQAGAQNIYSEEESTIGTISYQEDQLVFDFIQDWFFADINPFITLQGCILPGEQPVNLTMVDPVKNYGSFIVPVQEYPYYIVDINVQNCYAGY